MPLWTYRFLLNILQGRSKFIVIIVQLVQHWKVADLNPFRSYEDTTVRLAFKVALSFDATVILARGLVKCNAYPSANAWNLGDIANILHGAAAVVRVRKQATTSTLLNVY